MRRTAITISLVLLGTLAVSHAQWGRDLRGDPETDPNAFRITARADLEESLSRVERLKGQLPDDDDEERDFVINNILDLCQQQLNDRANDSGVIVVEEKDFVIRDSRGNVDEEESVYDVPVRWRGAFSAVEGEILSLGERGLELYEEAYGPRARVLFKDAVRQGDREALQALNHRFGLTEAGARAGTVLAAMLWEEGETSACARMLERVLSVGLHMEDARRADLSAWISHCYVKLGERANLSGLIAGTKDFEETEVNVGDESVKLKDLLERRLLQTRDGTTDTIDHLGVEWPGGNYMNTGMHEPPTDYKEVAWKHTLPSLRASRKGSFMGYESPVVPPHMPTFDGSNAYINNGDTLLAYDLVSSRDEPAWSVSAFDVDVLNNWRTSEPDPGHIMPVSVHRGTVFAALENPLHDDYHTREADSRFGLYSHYPKVRRAMCAVDANSGRLMWKLGGQYEGDKHETTNFLSAVVHDGVLYAIASRIPGQAEVFLYALDPATGDIHWNLRLCYGQQETTMFGRPAREPLPSLPAIANGKLYLCTNIGGVVSVDLLSRSIEWISRYDYMPRPVAKYIETYYRDVTFYNNPTIYTEHEGRPYVIVAPTDARKMFAMDARNGEVLWDVPQELAEQRGGLNGGRALVGVRDGLVITAGDGDGYGPNSRLHTLEVDSGRIAHSMNVSPPNSRETLMLAGRPAMTTNRLIWPGRRFGRDSGMLAEVDLDTMKVVKTIDVPGGYARRGYSVFAQHGVVFTVAGKNYAVDDVEFAARFDEGSLLEVARREFHSNREDAEAAARYGLLVLRLDRANREEALSLLRKAFELAAEPPADASVRERAGRALVAEGLSAADRALARSDFEAAKENINDARRYATGRAQLTDCFLHEERVVLAGASNADINRFYRGVIDSDPPFGVGDNPEIPAALYARIRLAERLGEAGNADKAVELWQHVMQSPDPYRYDGTPLRLLAIEKLEALMDRHGRDIYSPHEAEARALVDSGNADGYRACLARYPVSKASDKAALELAWAALQDDNPAEAVELLRLALEEFPGRERAAELNALLALAYAGADQTLRARLLATRVLREHPEGRLEVAGESRDFADALGPLTEGESGADGRTRAKLPQRIQQLWHKPWHARGFVRLPDHPAAGPHARIYYGENSPEGTRIVAADASTGDEDWIQEAPVTVLGAFNSNGGTLMHLGQGFALYDEEGSEVWSVTTGTLPEPVNLRGGMLLYGTRSSIPRSDTRLVRVTALDAATGDQVWESRMEAASIGWMEQTSAGVLVMTTGDQAALILLDIETGNPVARTDIDVRGRPRTAPVLDGGHLYVMDANGAVKRYAADSLRGDGTWETRNAFPYLFTVHEGDFIVGGTAGIMRYSADDDRPVWQHSLDTVTGNELFDDRVVITTRDSNHSTVIHAYAFDDGAQLFEHTVRKQNRVDRLTVQSTAAFDGGIVVVLADSRSDSGRVALWGFRMLVIDTDGTERFEWEFETGQGILHAQIALIDDYITITCGKNTVGFGRE